MITSFEKFALFQFFRQLHFTILQSQIDLVDNDITINVSKLLDLEMMNLQSFFLMYFLDKSELTSRPPPPSIPPKIFYYNDTHKTADLEDEIKSYK